MSAPAVVILAAGQGTRMRSAVPKLLHPLWGRPLVLWPVSAALAAGAGKIVVVGGPDGALAQVLPDGVELAVQPEPMGTGDAVKAALPHIDGATEVVVLMGDVPLIEAATIEALVASHRSDGAAATMATVELGDPTGYGRVVRAADGTVERVVETKKPGDATPQELAIREINTGIFAFTASELRDAIARIGNDNAQGEYYLPDVLPALRENGHGVTAFDAKDPLVVAGVNDRRDLALVAEAAQRRIQDRHLRDGVTINNRNTVAIDAEVEIGPDTVIEIGTRLVGPTRIGTAARIGPQATIIDSAIGDEAKVLHSYLIDATVESKASVGPFAYLRPQAVIREGAKIGTFVEVKNSDIGPGAKVPHLSYIGDADVGEKANLGAGTITANYDGRRKHRTKIGKHVHGGVDTAFVAPVTVGDGAYTAAGSVITKDVPAGALAIARERQRNIEGYAERKELEDPRQ